LQQQVLYDQRASGECAKIGGAMSTTTVNSAVQSDLLQQQIDAKRTQIHSDQYSISIGELANLYRDGEVDIHPEFQRFYRWDDEQKSRFIESILLGIPIPSIFVAQRDDGKWDVIDGLQRLSTIFQLMGLLKDEHGHQVAPLRLTRTKYLPSLDNMVWEKANELLSVSPALSPAQQLFIKRAKLDVKIILRQSDVTAKFELFQRLNTGGAELSAQEIRNAMLVAANQPFYRWMKDLAACPGFNDCVLLSERASAEQYDLELVLRFLVFRRVQEHDLRNIGDLGEFLTDRMLALSPEFTEFKDTEKAAFTKTFDLLASTAAGNAFRKYDLDRRKFTGGFSISAFEVVALGVGYNIDSLDPKLDIMAAIKAIWSNHDFLNSSGSGVNASVRIRKTVPLGRKQFQQ
jgi:hypothetical protein